LNLEAILFSKHKQIRGLIECANELGDFFIGQDSSGHGLTDPELLRTLGVRRRKGQCAHGRGGPFERDHDFRSFRFFVDSLIKTYVVDVICWKGALKYMEIICNTIFSLLRNFQGFLVLRVLRVEFFLFV
jgi:hypothetical protein